MGLQKFLYAFRGKTKCNLGITLTKNVDVIFRGMKFMPGGFDLVVVADVFCEQNMTNLSIPLQKIPIIQKSSFWRGTQECEKHGEYDHRIE